MNKYENKEGIWGVPFIGTPPEVFFNPKLTLLDKYLYSIISNLAQSEEGCWASNKYLGMILGRKSTAITDSVQRLKNYKYITCKNIRYTNPNGSYKEERHIYLNPKMVELYKPLTIAVHKLLREKSIDEKNYRQIREKIVNEIINGYEDENLKEGGRQNPGTPYRKSGHPPTGNPAAEEEYSNSIILTNNTITEYHSSFFTKRKNESSDVSEDFLSTLKSSKPRIYQIIKFWNTLNIVKHNINKQTKTINTIILILEGILKHYNSKEILDSIKIYYDIIKLYPNKFKKGTPYIVGLNNYFKYTKYLKTSIANSKNFKDLESINSLFEIFIEGYEYAESYFKPNYKLTKVKDPKIAQKIEDNLIDIIGIRKIKGKEKLIIKISNLFIDFYNAKYDKFRFTLVNQGIPAILKWMFKYIEKQKKFEVYHAAHEGFFINFENYLIDEGCMKS